MNTMLKPVLAADRRGQLVVACIILAGLALAPLVVYPVYVMKFMCLALFASSLNLLFGHAGLLSFGHAALFGAGAYTLASSARFWGFDPLVALVAAMVVAALVGLAMGYLAIRRSGIYFAMITLALAQMVHYIVQQASFSGGEDGLHDVPRGTILGVVSLVPSGAIYTFVLIVFCLGMLAMWRIISSPFGHLLAAVREHEARTTSLGYNVNQLKLAAFTISAAFAGLAGGLNALVFQFATLNDLGFQLSGEAILMVLIGGAGTLFGPLLGAAIVVFLQSFLATSNLPAPVLVGAVFVICVLLFRRGLVGEFLTRRARKAA